MPTPDEEITTELHALSKKLPHFPDGRINYSDAPRAVVLACFIQFQNKILLLKRSNQVMAYKRKWNTIVGFLDEIKPFDQKVREEIEEETGIVSENIARIVMGKKNEIRDEKIQKTWVVFPALAELKRFPTIKLDFEHTEFVWITPEEIVEYDIVPDLDKTLKNVLSQGR